ncbi:MAG: ABC transporter ATP-binding protein [Candidatus Eremiobacter antarcticus]|nr:ABC transporter ATP-binding protein [Candidatus Eremiobacteraeota bacterium]MBC5807654.1 ABC transporter ATP-binding protein [Candidatus Eremiobacteraeota bacterium]PZR60543.1 MAG: ABC transporter ATP-binding protein [Candidatus Eremiobacter sp. RRmetagenome_bin22]
MPVVEAMELYRFYHSGDEETFALRGVSLTVQPGQTVAVVGPSGSGKSTLLACLAGLDEPDGGYVNIQGRRLTRRSESARARLRSSTIGILMQSGNLLEHLSVEDNVRLRIRLAGATDDANRRVALLRSVGLDHRRTAYPARLSGGESARAGLAVALALTPALLLADEPTGEVDADTEKHIMVLLERRRKEGAATILATHSEALAAWADIVVRLVDGKIARD